MVDFDFHLDGFRMSINVNQYDFGDISGLLNESIRTIVSAACVAILCDCSSV